MLYEFAQIRQSPAQLQKTIVKFFVLDTTA